MRTTTRMGIRAALAVFLTEITASVLNIERGYWGIIVSTAIVGETWGLSVQRAAERLMMTAVGGLAGWTLHWILGNGETGRVSILFLSIFFSVYFRGLSYRWMIFFITLYVVFLLAVLGELTPSLVFLRVYDTAIGCAAALFAALVIRPESASRSLSRAFRRLWSECEKMVERAFESPGDGDPALVSQRLGMYQALLSLHAQRGISMYESLAPMRTKRDWNQLLQASRQLFHTVISLGEMLTALPKTQLLEQKEVLRGLQQEARAAFLVLWEQGGPDSSRKEGTGAIPKVPPFDELGARIREIKRLTRKVAERRKGIA